MKYRIKYVKKNNLAFISHLDILKVIQRAFRRSGINLEHTRGFNPHPKIHFAPPLPLFAESLGEYVDIQTIDDFTEQEIMERLNESLPENLHFIEVKRLEDDAMSLGKSIDYASYEITLCPDDASSVDTDEISRFVNESDEIIITKLNKKKREIKKDIRPGILSFSIAAEDDLLVINTDLLMRADFILSPNALLEALYGAFHELEECSPVRILKKDTVLF